MKHVRISDAWTEERGYAREILLPFEASRDGATQVQLTRVAPGEMVPVHYHRRQTEYIFFLEGECRYRFGSGVVDVKAGDLLVIEPMERHSTENSSAVLALFLTVKVDDSAGDTVWED
ncbi:cupin domain-containing protein [Kitasatospora sp. NPDC058444]|uniref:cupin domain-containing protein n=1 Tax=Kitasatospora sp. NPDC058444 TaxID=3346504 RepID=UPI00365EB41C